MKKTDTERLKKIVSLWDALSSEIEQRGISREMLLSEQFSQWAVTTPVYNIGEQVYQLSPEFKKEHPDVPWSVVSGLRHRLVHDYDGINWSLIADVIFDDMDPFVEQVKSILSEQMRTTKSAGEGLRFFCAQQGGNDMAYVKEHPPSEVYHLTKKENLNSILEDGMIRRFSDTECWFCVDLQKMKAYMEQTVMCEGKPYYDVTGQLCRYPKFVPEDYVLLKLIPCRQEDNWYRWEQEIPAGSPAALVRAAHEFSVLKIGYRGDLAFHNAEAIDVPRFLAEGVTQGEPVQTSTELWKALSQRIEDEMADYMRRLDLRTRDELIQTADEIDAVMTCDCELRLLGECLPREELVFLLEQDKPLEQMSRAWMAHRNVDVGETFQSLLTGLYAEQQHDMDMKM